MGRRVMLFCFDTSRLTVVAACMGELGATYSSQASRRNGPASSIALKQPQPLSLQQCPWWPSPRRRSSWAAFCCPPEIFVCPPEIFVPLSSCCRPCRRTWHSLEVMCGMLCSLMFRSCCEAHLVHVELPPFRPADGIDGGARRCGSSPNLLWRNMSGAGSQHCPKNCRGVRTVAHSFRHN